jgi:hypothetical protein
MRMSRASSAERSALGREHILPERNDLKLEDIAIWVRPILSGWVRYYGRFYPSKLRGELRTIDEFIVRWASRKYKSFRGRLMASRKWLHALKTPQSPAVRSLEPRTCGWITGAG